MTCEPIRSFSPAMVTTFTYTDPDDPSNILTVNLTNAGGSYIPLDKNNEIHRKLIQHLYLRMGYGAGQADFDFADGKSFNYIVNKLVDDADGLGFPTEFNWTDRPVSITRRVEGQFNLVPQTVNGLLSNYWINESIVDIKNSIRAKLMVFWHSHFAIEEKIFEDPYAILRYYKLLFNNAFGNFKEFVKSIGLTPLMLSYLNGNENHGNPVGIDNGAPFPNENYARELLELFTMGIKYQGEENYTRDDINMLARSLSGWRTGRYDHDILPPSEEDNELLFAYHRHDWTTKRLFEIQYGGYTPFDPEDPNPSNPLDIFIIDPDIPANAHLADNLVGWDKVFVPSGSSQRELFKPVESGEASPYQPYYTHYQFNASNGITSHKTRHITATPYEKNSGNYSTPALPVAPNPEDYTGGVNNADYIADLLAYKELHEEVIERKIITAALDEYNYVHDEIIFKEKQDAIAYFICKKLYNFYVYADTESLAFQNMQQGLSDNLDTYLEKLADVFIYGIENFNASTLEPTTDLSQVTPKWRVKDVLKVLFKSQHFFDAGVMGTQIKSPIACAASFFRAGNLKPGLGTDGVDGSNIYQYRYRMALLNDITYTPVDASHSNYYPIAPNYHHVTGEGIDPADVDNGNGRSAYNGSTTIAIRNMCGTVLGQKLLSLPDVAGWPGHHNWLNEYTLIKRWEMISNYLNSSAGMVTEGLRVFRQVVNDLPDPTTFHQIEVPEFTSANAEVEKEKARKFITKAWRHFVATEPTPRQLRDALSVYLDAHPYETFFPSVAADNEMNRDRIRELILHFIRQPEFQLA